MHVLQIVHVCGSGMDGFEPFQKRTLSRVPECAEISCSGTYYFKAFRNGKKLSFSERFWFWNPSIWGVPECLFFKHSGTTHFPLDQNTNYSQNIVFREFRKVCFSSIPEQHIFPLIRTQNIPKTLFLGGVPGCLFFKHSGTTQFPLDQNTKHS